MPEPERHTPVSAPRPVQAGLGVEDIRHIPVQKRELRFTRNRAGAILTAWRQAGIRGSLIGEMTADHQHLLVKGGQTIELPSFAADEITKVFAD